MSLLRVSLACAALLFLALIVVEAKTAPTPNSVVLNADGSMIVDGKPFKVKGIAYSPVPIGESVHFAPYGDYFTTDYVYLWARDLPLLRAMGVNTLRIYAWSNEVNHGSFLDACEGFGLKVIITHYVGTSIENPVKTSEERKATVDAFVKHIQLLGDHPAILAWSFGNELNGVWNGFTKDLSTVNGCGWTAGCLNIVDASSSCHTQQTCMYTALFSWLEEAMKAAKAVTTRPLTSTFADVDFLISGAPTTDKIPRFSALLPSMDMYAVQLYRGKSFASYFTDFAAESTKPLLVGEYGVDAMNDPCGWSENFDTMQPCFNWNTGMPGTKGGADVRADFIGCDNFRHDCKRPGVTTQEDWDSVLTKEIMAAPKTVGGILMEWNDQYWKNIGTQDFCEKPCPKGKDAECADPTSALYATLKMGGSGKCTYKAHVSCANYDTKNHDLCGYWLGSAPDQYVNEAWFGLNSVTDCNFADVNGGHRLSSLTARPVIASLTTTFGGIGGSSPSSCSQLRPCWECARAQSQDQIAIGACDAQCGMKFTAATTTPPSTLFPPPTTTTSTGASDNTAGSTSTGSASSPPSTDAPVTQAPGGVTDQNAGDVPPYTGPATTTKSAAIIASSPFVTLVAIISALATFASMRM